MNKRVRRKLQRVKRKRFTRVEVKDGLFEMDNGDVDLSRCPYYRVLFPKAKTVTFYYHWFFGYDVLVVDGKFRGELDSVNELLSFHYHTGCNFKDIDDLRDQYYTFLEEYNRWLFLPYCKSKATTG